MSEMVMMPKSDAQAIWDKVREKTGVSGLLKSGEIAPLIDTITGGGGSEVKEIIPETDFSFVEAGGGIYAYTVENTYQLEEGKTYKISWDGEEYEFVWTLYTLTVMDGQVIPIGHALGNPYFFNIYSGGATNFEDTGDPFMIGIASDNTFAILTNETNATHTVAVYEGSTGGNSDDVRYVTFMSEDGSTELLVKPVAVGDDCANVIDRGLIDTPTKESTPQYNYTFNGWALSAGGTADANALKSVTEDRVVYVAFKPVLRYYTINYYDGETLNKTESLAYGSMPSHTIEKKGYTLIGWEPALTTVTGDADYYAQWQAGISFATASWEEIAEVAENGTASEVFSVGDTKIVNIKGTDVPFVIAGFNHDDLADGSGKAGISIVTKDVAPIKITRLTGLHKNFTTCVDDVFMQYLPESLTKVIKPVLKECESSLTAGIAETDTEYVSFNLFPISFYELGLWYSSAGIGGKDSAYSVLGTPYEFYEDMGVGAPPNVTNRTFKKAGTIAESSYDKIHAVLRGVVRSSRTNPELMLVPSNTISYEPSGNVNIVDKNYYRPFGFCI